MNKLGADDESRRQREHQEIINSTLRISLNADCNRPAPAPIG